jgi:8-oxo-dGTP pyrophosphatase MutT (NUDIX family)
MIAMGDDIAPTALDAAAQVHVAGVRPQDAASLILIDRSHGYCQILVGRRGSGHVFMPDVYVFPGGRRDPRDHALPFASDLHPLVLAKLLAGAPAGTSAARARALALAALRELTEETGIGFPGGAAELAKLRYVARAITPPGHIRRYDTRFFLAFADETDLDLAALQDSAELQDLQWLDIRAVSGLKLPRITETVLEEVKTLLATDPSLPFGTAVSFYSMRHGRFVRSRL